jgi:hypothetical protein
MQATRSLEDLEDVGESAGQRTVFPSIQTNRLTGTGTSYDAFGNLTARPTEAFMYDLLSRMTRYFGSGGTEEYLYDGAGDKVVRIGVVPNLSIVSASLPFGTYGSGYSAQLRGFGGTTPYSWSLLSGALPAGLQLYPNGTISGTPTGSGIYVFTVRPQEAAGAWTTAQSMLTVQAGTGFFTVTPCRVYDSRDGLGDILTVSTVSRTIHVAGLCNVPSAAMAVALNATAVTPTADTVFTLYPAGVPMPAATIVVAKAGGVRAGFGIQAISGPTRGTPGG